MGLFDKMKEFVGLPSENEYDDDMDIITSHSKEYEEERPAPDTTKRNKVVNINATTQLQVVLAKPEKFDDATAVADHLNAKRTVVLNLETAPKEVSRRLIDFLTGVAYANKGNIQLVANSTFIITPYNVDFMDNNILGELENNGLYFN